MTNPRQSQEQTQHRDDKEPMPIDREPGPLGEDRKPEGNKPAHKQDDKTGTERDPARISPQDDLA
jgi:hypothetical protein